MFRVLLPRHRPRQPFTVQPGICQLVTETIQERQCFFRESATAGEINIGQQNEYAMLFLSLINYDIKYRMGREAEGGDE